MIRIVRAVIAKDWLELRRNRTLLMASIIPTVLLIAMPLIIARVGVSANSIERNERIAEVIARNNPELRMLDRQILIRISIFRQFLMFQLILPVMIAISIATYSIIGEKQVRSLEPLLATPITSLQLIIAKSLTSAIPTIALSWSASILYGIALWLTAGPIVFWNVFNTIGVTVVLVVSPLVAVLGLSAGVIVSSRMNDPRSAQQIGALIILPLIALIVAQLQGFFFLTLPLVFLAAIVLALVDLAVFGWGVALFDRETILTRWK